MTPATTRALGWLEEQLTDRLTTLGGERAALSILGENHRASCTLVFLRASSDAGVSEMVAKIPHQGDQAPVDDGRPRCFPILDPRLRSRCEFAALQSIARHFRSLQDPRFGSLEPLYYDPESGAIVTRRVREPTLHRQFVKSHRLRFWRTFHRLSRASANSGAWLREFHTIRAFETTTRFASANDLAEICRRLCSYLQRQGGQMTFLDDVGRSLQRHAESIDRSPLASAPCHGDFAARNIFVDHSERVTVFDPLAMWRAPIYQDIAEFLANMKASGLQCVSLQLAHSPRQIVECEQAFLRGYFGETKTPLQRIRFFEAHAYLAKWASVVSRGAGFLSALQGRTYRQLVATAMHELDVASAKGAAA